MEIMKLFYEEAANKPGIYKIINTHTDRIYIGQAARFERRWYDHQKTLKNGRHGNRFMLNDFSKCFQELNHDNFIEFYVLEIMEGSTKEERNLREEWYIAQFYDKQDKCYNFKQKTSASERSCFSKTLEETKKILSQKSKELWNDPEFRELNSKKIKAFYNSPEGKEKASARGKEAWANDGGDRRKNAKQRATEKMKDPEIRKQMADMLAEVHEQSRESFRKHLKEDPEFKGKMSGVGRNVANTINKKYKENPAFKAKMDELSIRNIQEFNKKKMENLSVKGSLISPNGEVFEDIKNLSDFARQHGLDPSGLYKLFNNKLKSVKEWRLYHI